MYTLFDTPIRSHQARWLDSGVFDEYVYDFTLKQDVLNPSPLAVRGRREAVLRFQKNSLSSTAWLGLWINTNKTAKYDIDVVGYTIPYVSDTHARLLESVLAWSCPCNSGHANTVRLMTRQHA
ncbi:VPA1269 family protein [Ralstonia pseudosolanacearum]|uniref:VPA1269 family protein n=2 Tax=Ralstonia pseudosolanacearum TaxID=1310165 RepID=UPI0039C70C7A